MSLVWGEKFPQYVRQLRLELNISIQSFTSTHRHTQTQTPRDRGTEAKAMNYLLISDRPGGKGEGGAAGGAGGCEHSRPKTCDMLSFI